MNTPTTQPTVDGRRFSALHHTAGGEVGPETVFDYHETDGEIWATFTGGTVRRGFLVGTRNGDTLAFRYSQLNQDGETSTGRCTSRITRSETGVLRLEETWAWESRAGNGTSIVEEIS